LRGDTINPPLLGMGKVVSEDLVKSNSRKMDEIQGVTWLRGYLGYCGRSLLSEPWLLDVAAPRPPPSIVDR
jgi:hypothetical protein